MLAQKVGSITLPIEEQKFIVDETLTTCTAILMIWILVILLVVAFLTGVIEAEKRSEEYFKAAEDKPSMSTKNWEQHQRRLNKFGESKYRDRQFYFKKW